MDEVLRKLALYHTSHLLYVDDDSQDKRKVSITVIGAVSNNNHLYGIKKRDIIVRASTITHKSYNSGNSFKELKWEGKLQDWYQACADIVNEISGYEAK